MNERVEGFLEDVLSDEGKTSAQVRENALRYLAELEDWFRHDEVEERKKDAAAQRCRDLCRDRVIKEIDRFQGAPTEIHLQIVLRAIDNLARAPSGRTDHVIEARPVSGSRR